ncbi:MAG: hypothetical protein RLZZ298_2269 [Pseudomonadota bacterium]|jgi:hydroxyethylthiazole kinase-like uncharacterized protein yjeF
MATDLYLSPSLRLIETRHSDQPLMQRAGAAAAEWAATLASERNQPVLVLAGPGNNGGDAFAAARLLRERFFDVRLIFASDPAKLPKDAAAAYQRFREAGGITLPTIPDDTHWSLIIDGIFGIGLTRAPAGPYAEWIATANRQASRDNCPLLALDCPSGLNADSGQTLGNTIMASHTLTFIFNKPGLLTADGPDHCGEIRVADLDLVTDADLPADGRIVSRTDFAAQLKPRQRNSHKGSFGSAGIIGGSKSMLGAALLAGRAALKLGSGLVYVGLLDPEPPSVDLNQPELMLRRPEAVLQSDLRALACGPGLGRSGEASRVLEQSLKCPVPLVLDADALNILATDGRLEGNLYNRVAPVILTPHPAEAARLLGCSVREVQADRIRAACELARRYRCEIALKGCGTVIATTIESTAGPRVDGDWWINTTGNPGMATAGMGDVLTGMITALLAQGWPAVPALLAAVHLHGAAADQLVANGCGPIGLSAGEVIAPARQLFNEWAGTGKAY